MSLRLRLVAGVDVVWLACRRWKARQRACPTIAGSGVQASGPVVCQRLGNIDWPGFPQLAHSFWRAQELTLFRRHQRLFATPMLDLGCGDGLFAQLAGFPEVGVGVDYDFISLAAAPASGASLARVQADAGSLPLRDGSVAVCLSNSVLEHLPSLEKCFAEVYRVLRPGGQFVFTMTLGVFTAQLRALAGANDARYWVKMFGHHQEPDEAGLLALLQTAGFAVQTKITYQSTSFTARYRWMSSPMFQYYERRCGPGHFDLLRERLAGEVAQSIEATPAGQGACVFIAAAKGGA